MDKPLFLIKSYDVRKNSVVDRFYFYDKKDLKSNFDFFYCNEYTTKLFILNNGEYCEIFSIDLSRINGTVSFRVFFYIVESITSLFEKHNVDVIDVVDSYKRYGNFAIDHIIYEQCLVENAKEIYIVGNYFDYYDELYSSYTNYRNDYEKYAYADFGKYISKKIINGETEEHGTVTGIFEHLIDYEKLGRMMCTDYENYGWRFIGTHFYRD